MCKPVKQHHTPTQSHQNFTSYQNYTQAFSRVNCGIGGFDGFSKLAQKTLLLLDVLGYYSECLKSFKFILNYFLMVSLRTFG